MIKSWLACFVPSLWSRSELQKWNRRCPNFFFFFFQPLFNRVGPVELQRPLFFKASLAKMASQDGWNKWGSCESADLRQAKEGILDPDLWKAKGQSLPSIWHKTHQIQSSNSWLFILKMSLKNCSEHFELFLELDRQTDKRWLSRNLGDGASKSDN